MRSSEDTVVERAMQMAQAERKRGRIERWWLRLRYEVAVTLLLLGLLW